MRALVHVATMPLEHDVAVMPFAVVAIGQQRPHIPAVNVVALWLFKAERGASGGHYVNRGFDYRHHGQARWLQVGATRTARVRRLHTGNL